MTTTPTPPAAPAASRIAISQIIHGAATAVLAAAILGFWGFYKDTNAELAALRGDLAGIRDKVDEVYRIMDRAHPRGNFPSGEPEP